MQILSNLSVSGLLGLNSVADANTDTDKFLVLDSSGIVRYRTGTELYNDIGAGGAASYTSTLQHEVKAGVALTKGQAVYVTSADGTNMVVSKASNASEATSSKTLGLIAQDLSINGKGYVITEGLLAGLDTSTANAGDAVWLGTDGNLIYGLGAKPYAPDHLVFIGIVTRAHHNNGEIFVKVQNGFELQELHNVQITSTPSDNTVLAYENSTSLYKMKSISTLLGYTPVTNARSITINGTTYDLSADRSWSVGTHTGNLTTGYVPKATGATTLTDSLIYDNGSGIGINTASPYESSAFKLDVNGGLLIKNTSGTAAQLILINSNPATGGNNGFVQLSAGGNTSTAFGQWQTYYGMSVASGALRLQPAGGQVLIGTTTTSAFLTDINGTLRVSGQLTLGSTISNNTYVYTMPGASGTLALVSDIPSLSGYLTISSAAATYLTQSSASSTYLTLTNASATYLSQTSASNTYLTLTNAASTYLSQTSAASNYLTLANAASTYLSQTSAASNYLTISNASSTYLTQSSAASNYVSLSGSYANPSWITSLAWSKITGAPAFITGITSGMVTTALGYTPVTNARTITINGTAYDLSADRSWTVTATETDTLASVTSRGASTSAAVTVSNIFTANDLRVTTGYLRSDNAIYNLTLTGSAQNVWAKRMLISESYYGNEGLIPYGSGLGKNTLWVHDFGASRKHGAVISCDNNGEAHIYAVDFANSTGDGTIGGSAGGWGWNMYYDGLGDEFFRMRIGEGGTWTEVLTIDRNENVRWKNTTGFTINGNAVWHAGNLTNLNQLSNGPGYITGYTETDTLNSVTSRGSTTSNAVTVGLLIAQGPGGNYNENVRLPGSTAVISFNTSGATGAGSYNIVSQTNFQIRNANGSQVFIMDQSGNLTMSGNVSGNYILGTYFNASLGNSENPTIGQIWTQNTSDNYLRKSTPAHFISQLGLITSSNIGSQSVSYASSAATATYATNSTKLYASDAPYTYGGAAPYYMYMTYDGSRWLLQVSPATPSAVRVSYADSAGSASSASTSSQVTINYNNDSNSNYQLLWGSGNSVYGTGSVYVNPSSDTIYAVSYRGSGNVGGTGEATHHPAGIYSQGTQWLYGTTYRNNATTSGQGQMYFDGNFGYGMVGLYASTRYQAIFAMGDAYKLPVDGTSTGSLYGLAWSHPNAGGVAGNLNTHGLLVMENGAFLAAVSGSIRARDDMRAPIFYDSNDTTYYLDPNSSGKALNIAGNIDLIARSASWAEGIRVRVPSTSTWGGIRFTRDRGNDDGNWAIGYTGINSSDDLTFWANNGGDGGTFKLQMDKAGNSTFQTSVRAPIFYDSNDTGYYADFNSTGTSIRTRGEIYIGANSSGRYLRIGGNGGGTDEATVSSSNGNLHIDCKAGYGLYLNYYSNNTIYLGSGYTITSNGAYYNGRSANSDALGGYSGSNFLGKNGNSYYQQDTWIQLNGAHGLYAPSYNGAHWFPNVSSSYTTWRIAGSRNGYSGIHDEYSAVQISMFDSGGNGGTYREANGRWYWYYHLGNASMGINSSTTSSSYALYVNGAIYATGDVVAYSDKRKKKNIETIENALEKVTSLRGVFYDKIGEEDKGRQLGVIAQEVNEVLPEAVNYAADVDEYGVKYGNMVGVLIEAIKEQQTQIEDLKGQLNGITK